MKKFSKQSWQKKKELLKDKLKRSEERIKEQLKVRFVIFLFLVVLIFFGVLLFAARLNDMMQGAILIYGLLAVFIIAFVSDMLMQPIGPDVPLVVGILAGMGPIKVTAVVILASAIATVLGYYLGLKLGADGLKRIYGEKKYAKLVKTYHRYHFIVPIAALTPVPYVPVCWFSGILKMDFVKFLLYAIIPRAIRLIVVAVVFYLLWY
ncbi:MAG: VTT domain-containing protein [Candidatus Woesearchaeota archaeon]